MGVGRSLPACQDRGNNLMDQCDCTPEEFPFFCERNRREMTEHLHNLCRTDVRYSALFLHHATGISMPPTAYRLRATLEERINAFYERRVEELEKKLSQCNALRTKPGPRYRSHEEALQLVAICRECDQLTKRDGCGVLKGCGRDTTHQHLIVSSRGRCPRNRF